MAFTRLMLTTKGQILQAKSHQGKGLHITRVAVGDGMLSTGESLITRGTLVHEVMSLGIDAIQLTQEGAVSAVIATLTNKTLDQGFYFREIAICAQDPDTGEEINYLTDYAGQDAEFIPDKDSPRKISERLRFLIRTDNIDLDKITFNWSGNPLCLLEEDIDDTTVSPHMLWSSQKINSALTALTLEDIDCGLFEDLDELLRLHCLQPDQHQFLLVDGNETDVLDEQSETLEEHMIDPLAHPNIHLDGNMN